MRGFIFIVIAQSEKQRISSSKRREFGELTAQLRNVGDRQPENQSCHQHCNRQQVVPTSPDSPCTQHKRFLTTPPRSLVVVCDAHHVVPSLQRQVDDAPDLPEIRNPSCPHPHREMLVFRVDPLSRGTVGCSTVGSADIFRPSDALLGDGDRISIAFVEDKCVIEEVFGESTTRTCDCIGVQFSPVPAGRDPHFYVGNKRLAQVGPRGRNINPLKLFVALTLGKQPLVLEEVAQLIAKVDGRCEPIRQTESYLADLTLFLAGSPAFLEVGNGRREEGGHRREHGDRDNKQGEGAQREADDRGFVGEADGFVPEQKLQEFAIGIERNFQVVIFLEVGLDVDATLVNHLQSETIYENGPSKEIVYCNPFSSSMQEQFPRQQSRHGAICGDKARLHIKLDPQTMELMVPLHWEVNKLKCYLNYLIPKFEFGMMRLEHDGQELPGMSTFQKVLAMDQDEQCMTRGAFAVRIILVKDTSSFEFQKYYAHKILPLMSSMRNSPYEPILNPHYSGLLSELNHLRKIDGSNGRPNFQELINLRNLIARNRPLGEGAGNQDANQQVEQLENMEGAGVFGPRPAANGNIFERGGYFIFKLLQILLLWQLIQVIYNHISAAHILILVVIIATYFCIDHFQKARKAQNPADPNPQPQQQPQLSDESSEQASGNGPVGSSRQQQVLDQVKADVLNSRMPSWVVSIFQFFCLLFEVVVSFSMSMFPNWSIQLHNRMLQRTFDSVDHILQQWQRPSQAKVEREQSEEFGQEASEEDEAVRVEQPSGEE